jgi:hypothetical protein
LSKYVSTGAAPAWLGEPLNLLLTGSCTTDDLGEEVAFQWATIPPVTIIFEKSRDPNSHDLNFIAMIIRNQSVYVEKAAEFLLQDLKLRTAGEIDVSEPRLYFRLDDRWDVHFHNALPKETEGWGVAVNFRGELPKSVEVLDDME